jgi:O-antigen ligase
MTFNFIDSKKNFQYILPLFFIFPIFKESFLTLLIVILFLNTLHFVVQNKMEITINRTFLLLTIPFWIVLFSSLFYFKNFETLKPVKNVLFFLLFPILFYYIPKSNFTDKKIKKYITILKNSCLFIIFVYIITFFYHYSVSDFFIVAYRVSKFRQFAYEEIGFFKIHPTYFTSIVLFCLAFSLINLFRNKKWSELLYIVFFTLIIFLLVAKINLIFLFLFVFIFPLIFLKRLLFQKILFYILFLFISIFLIKHTPGLYERFHELTISLSNSPKDLAYDSTNIRVALYNCDYSLAKDNFWFGVGFENIKNEIEHCLKSNYNSSFYLDHQYLSHNYYLYILISSGIFGLIGFLIYLIHIFKIALRVNLFLFYFFFINVIAVSLTEDFFYRAFGSFYFNLIVLMYLKNYWSKSP